MANLINLEAPIGALKTQLSKLLLSVDRVGWLLGTTSGRFDVRRTSRMLAGSERVFKSRTEQPAVTTAVSIVVDLSTSMKWGEKDSEYVKVPGSNEAKRIGLEETRINVAAQAAFAIAAAVERSNCEVEVNGFRSHIYDQNGIPSTKGMKTQDGEVIGSKRYDFDQYATGELVSIKSFSQRVAARKGVFERMQYLVYGSTPDYHTVRTAVENMTKRDEHRKIVIVITDGEGDPYKMKNFCKFAEKTYHVPVLALGIMSNDETMSKAYNNFATVKKLSDLGETAIKSLIAQVEKMRVQHA